MRRPRRNIFYKAWLFLEIMTIKKLLLNRNTSSHYLSDKYTALVKELKNII